MSPLEISAEMYAIQEARHYLQKECNWSKKQADKYLLKYIKTRIKISSSEPRYFGIKYARNLDKVLASFQDKLDKALEQVPLFDYETAIEYNGHQKAEDAFFQKFIKHPERQEEWGYNKVNTGWEQRKIMTASAYRFDGLNNQINEGNIFYNADWLKDPTLIVQKETKLQREELIDFVEPENPLNKTFTKEEVETQLKEVKENMRNAMFRNGLCLEAQMEVAKQYPDFVKYWEYSYEEVQLYAISQDESLAEAIPHPCKKVEALLEEKRQHREVNTTEKTETLTDRKDKAPKQNNHINKGGGEIGD